MKPVKVWIAQDKNLECFVYDKKPKYGLYGFTPMGSLYATKISDNVLKDETKKIVKCVIITEQEYKKLLEKSNENEK